MARRYRYGVLTGLDAAAATLIRAEVSETEEWQAVARGKRADLLGIAADLNELDLLQALTSGSNDVAVPPPDDWKLHTDAAAAPDLTPEPGPDYRERNREAIDREFGALPIDWNSREQPINMAALQMLNREALTELSARLWADGKGGYRDGGTFGRRYTKYGADYLQRKDWQK